MLGKILSVIGCFMVSFSAFAVSDADITATVKQRMNSNINVKTNNGVVFLSGNVDSEKQAEAAIERANSIPGVKDVNNDDLLVNDSSEPYKDAYITAKVKGAFVREKVFGQSIINVTDITVETRNGVVYLSGVVNSDNQIKIAIKLAKGINGVKDVESIMTVGDES